MPGGMGGMPGGMGGMGGGLMGMVMGRGGGMSQGQSLPSTSQTTTEIYDVTRWKQAETDDPGAPTAVQAVRADWERKKQEKVGRFSLKERFAAWMEKRPGSKAAKAPQTVEEPRPVGGTVQMPELKKASQRIKSDKVPEAAAPAPEVVPTVPGAPNYYGLSVSAEIDRFFAENPLNSTLLAVDTLSMDGLALNQVEKKPLPVTPETTPPPEAPSQTVYMDAVQQARQARKYDVRIT